MTCRLPDHTTSNILPNGSHASTTFGASGGAPAAIGVASWRASPSVYTRSGSNVSAASRAPSIGISPMGLARISPSPRHASAHATTQISARVGSFTSSAPGPGWPGRSGPGSLVCRVPAPRWFASCRRSCERLLGQAPVLALGHVHVARAKGDPGVRVLRRGRVLALDLLVALVIGNTVREVRTERRLHHPVGPQAADPDRVDRPGTPELVGIDDALARHERAFRRHGEQVVEVPV